MSVVHYLYTAYHALTPDAELKYTSLLLKGAFAVLYGWTSYLAVTATHAHLFRANRSYTVGDWLILSTALGMTAVLCFSRYRLSSHPVDD